MADAPPASAAPEPAPRADAAGRGGADRRARLLRDPDRRRRRRAGASPALVIYYFSTKDELLTEALRFSEKSFYDAARSCSSSSGRAPRASGSRCSCERPACRRSRARSPAPGDCGSTCGRRRSGTPRSPRTASSSTSAGATPSRRSCATARPPARSGDRSTRALFGITFSALLDGLSIQVALEDPVVDPERAFDIAMAFAGSDLGVDVAPASRRSRAAGTSRRRQRADPTSSSAGVAADLVVAAAGPPRGEQHATRSPGTAANDSGSPVLGTATSSVCRRRAGPRRGSRPRGRRPGRPGRGTVVPAGTGRRPPRRARCAPGGRPPRRGPAHLAGHPRAGRCPSRQVRASRPASATSASKHVGRPEEARDVRRLRARVDLLGRPDLLDHAVAHHREPVGHRQGFLLVVRHVDERHADRLLDRLELELQVLAQLGVQGAQRLVEEQHPGLSTSARASATRCCWPPDSWPGRRWACSLIWTSSSVSPTRRCRLGLVDVLVAQPERHVVPHVEEREQRVGLEDGVDRPTVRRRRAPGRRRRAGSGRTSGRSKPAIIRSVVVLPQPGRRRAARRTRRRGCRGRCRGRRARRRTAWSARPAAPRRPRHRCGHRQPVTSSAQSPGWRRTGPRPRRRAAPRAATARPCPRVAGRRHRCAAPASAGARAVVDVEEVAVGCAPVGRGSARSPWRRRDDLPGQALGRDVPLDPGAGPGRERVEVRVARVVSTSSRVARAAAIDSGLPLKVPTCS